jgi:hypothetical protein
MNDSLVPSLTRSFRRRWFLSALSSAGWLAWLASRDALAAPKRGAKAGAVAVTSVAPKSWSPFMDHLIPADEWTPCASALGVDRQLWAQALKDAEYARLVTFGCQWLDRYHPQGFVGLSFDEREALLTWMSQAPWEAPQRRFFDLVRDHAMTLYYLQPAARRGTLLEEPPQPGGRAINLPPLPKLGEPHA